MNFIIVVTLQNYVIHKKFKKRQTQEKTVL